MTKLTFFVHSILINNNSNNYISLSIKLIISVYKNQFKVNNNYLILIIKI